MPPEAGPLALARYRPVELLEAWEAWKGQTVHGILIRTKECMAHALARDSTLEAKATLLDWRGIKAELRAAAPRRDARVAPVSPRTIWDWLAKYRRGGLAALEDPPRRDAGSSRYFDSHRKAAAFLLSKRLGEGLNLRHAYEALVREWSSLGEPGDPPGYGSCRRLLNNPRYLPEAVKILALEGEKKFIERCGPHLVRDPQSIEPMDWWVLDHRVHDILCRNTLFDFLEPERAYRLWKTLVYDWRSTAIVGFCWAPVPSSATINSAMRVAAAEHGFPRNLYWDNGKDFRSVERALVSPELTGLLRDRQVEITRALPLHPRSKPIESWFKLWAARFDPLWKPAYTGSNPRRCLPECRQAQKEHDRYLAGKRQNSPLPADAEVIAAALKWVDEYNRAPRTSLGGRAPLDIFAGCPPERRQPASPLTLTCLLGKRDRRIVQRGGTVELDRLRYEPAEESLGAITAWIGREIVLARDPFNLAEALALDPVTNELLGELSLVQPVAQSPHGRLSQDHIRTMRRREQAVKRQAMSYLYALEAVSRAQGWQTERERLSRAALPAAAEAVAAAAPGARAIAAPTRETYQLDSPFVDDAVRKLIAVMKEDKPTKPKPGHPIVGDAVAEDVASGIFDHIETED